VANLRILILVEHLEREYLFAILLKNFLKKCGHTAWIANLSIPPSLARNYQPELIFLPYYYREDDSTFSPFFSIKSTKLFVSLSWEQFFNELQCKAKIPDRIRDNLILLSWSDSWKKQLVENGLDAAKIRVTGHPMYSIYWRLPFKSILSNKMVRGKKLYVENFDWMIPNSKKLRKLNLSAEETTQVENIQKTVIEVMRGLNFSNILVKLRPSARSEHIKFIRKISPRLQIKRGKPLLHYYRKSSHCIGDFSSALIESAILGIPTIGIAIDEIPARMKFVWQDLFVPLKYLDGRQVKGIYELKREELISFLSRENCLNEDYFNQINNEILSLAGDVKGGNKYFATLDFFRLILFSALGHFSLRIFSVHRKAISTKIRLDPNTHTQDLLTFRRYLVYRFYSSKIQKWIM
jgi:hypothetical protein